MIEYLSKAKDSGIMYLPTQCDTIMPHFMNQSLLTFLSLISKYTWTDSIRMTLLYLFIENIADYC